jgi:hypothetical protein
MTSASVVIVNGSGGGGYDDDEDEGDVDGEIACVRAAKTTSRPQPL